MIRLLNADQVWARQKQLVVDTQQPANELFSLLFRSYYGCADLSELSLEIQSLDSAACTLESARNAIGVGDLSRAEQILLNHSPVTSIEKAEWHLECARVKAYAKNWGRALEHIEKSFVHKLVPISRVSAHQVRGAVRFGLGEYTEALRDFKKAVMLGEEFPLAQSSFYAQAFLVKTYAQLQKLWDANEALTVLKIKLDEMSEHGLWLDRLLVYLRAESFYFEAVGESQKQKQSLIEIYRIASWSGHSHIRIDSQNDWLRLGESDLTTLAQHNSEIRTYPGWIHIARHELILSNHPKKWICLKNKNLFTKMLQVLADGPVSTEQFFNRVWGHTYKEALHQGHVRANLSKLRRLLPTGALENSNGVISLRGTPLHFK